MTEVGVCTVSSTSYPYEYQDIPRSTPTGIGALLLMRSRLTTTSWTYGCPYCGFKRVTTKPVTRHIRRVHADQPAAVEVSLE